MPALDAQGQIITAIALSQRFNTAAPDQRTYRDPAVYSDPAAIARLNPDQQVLANINRAEHGMTVGGDQTRTLEATLAGAGFSGITFDGQLSDAEMAAAKAYKERQEDSGLKNGLAAAGTAMVAVAAGEQLQQVVGSTPFNLAKLGEYFSGAATGDKAPIQIDPPQQEFGAATPKQGLLARMGLDM